MATTRSELVDRAEAKIEGFREEVSSLRKRCANKRPQGDDMPLEINDSDIEDIQDDMDDVDSDYEFELLMPKPVKIEFVGNSVADNLNPPNSNILENSVQSTSGGGSSPSNKESGTNANSSADSDATYFDEDEATNNVSSSSENEKIDDPLSGNLHYVEDVSTKCILPRNCFFFHSQKYAGKRIKFTTVLQFILFSYRLTGADITPKLGKPFLAASWDS